MKHVPCDPGPGIWVDDPNTERNTAIKEHYIEHKKQPEPPEQYARGRYVIAALVVLLLAWVIV